MTGSKTNPADSAWVDQAGYLYDGAGDRARQVDYTGAQPVTTTYTNDIAGLTQALVAADGTSQTANLFGLDLVLQDNGTVTRTLLADGLGSVRTEVISDSVETTTTYSPYGKVLRQEGDSGTVYGFTGEQYDDAAELLYLRARYYSPSLKNFMSRDPWEGTGWRPGTLNYYAYALGNPTNFVDPSGHDAECWTLSQTKIANDVRCDSWVDWAARRLQFHGGADGARLATLYWNWKNNPYKLIVVYAYENNPRTMRTRHFN